MLTSILICLFADQSNLTHPDVSTTHIMNIYLLSKDNSTLTDTHYGAVAEDLNWVVIHMEILWFNFKM